MQTGSSLAEVTVLRDQDLTLARERFVLEQRGLSPLSAMWLGIFAFLTYHLRTAAMRQRVGRDDESQLGQRIALKKFIVKLLNLGPCCIHLTDRVIYLVSGGALPKFGHHFIDRGLAFIPST